MPGTALGLGQKPGNLHTDNSKLASEVIVSHFLFSGPSAGIA